METHPINATETLLERGTQQGKKLPLTVTTHNIVHTFRRELMERVNCILKKTVPLTI